MRKTRLAAFVVALSLITGNSVLAAELLVAELEGTVNDVQIEQGTTANFTISLTASGNVACGSSHTAAVHTAYDIAAGGVVSSATMSPPRTFLAGSGDGNNCQITWAGAPAPQTVSASVTAAATTPIGTYTVTLKESNNNTVTTSTNSSGGKLDDKDGTTLTFRVVAPTATDTAKPTGVAVTIDSGAAWTKTTAVSLALAASDNVGITRYRLAESAAGLTTAADVTIAPAEAAFSRSDVSFSLTGADSASKAVWLRVYDAAGNFEDASDTIGLDRVAPVVSVTGATDGATYYVGLDVPTSADLGCSTTDALSGVKTSAALEAVTVGLGQNTVTCSGAEDNAGNVNTETITFYVQYERDGGIGQPINPDGTSVFNQKRAVPVKFQLKNDEPGGFPVSDFVLRRRTADCATGTATSANETAEQPLQASTGWRYDADADQYVFNASLTGTTVGNCYYYTVTLGDGGAPIASAVFRVGK